MKNKEQLLHAVLISNDATLVAHDHYLMNKKFWYDYIDGRSINEIDDIIYDIIFNLNKDGNLLDDTLFSSYVSVALQLVNWPAFIALVIHDYESEVNNAKAKL